MPKSNSACGVAAVEAKDDDSYRKTAARIEKIQSHLSRSARGSRLKGKVCVITGVGSLKGIGYALCSQIDVDGILTNASSRASALLFANESAAEHTW